MLFCTLTAGAQSVSVSGAASASGQFVFTPPGAGTVPTRFSFGINKGGSATLGGFPAPTVAPAGRKWRSNGGERWFQIETSRGVFVWTNFDQWQTNSTTYGYQLVYTFNTIPTWANGGLSNADPPNDINVSAACSGVLTGSTTTNCQFKEFVTALMQHSCPNWATSIPRTDCTAKIFEMWNEANADNFWNNTGNLTTWDGYGDLAKMSNDAATIIRQYCSNCTVVGGSMAGATGGHRPCFSNTTTGGCSTSFPSGDSTLALTQYLNKWHAIAGASLPDKISFHVYPSREDVFPPPMPEMMYSVAQTTYGQSITDGGFCTLANTPNVHCSYKPKDLPANIRTALHANVGTWTDTLKFWNTEWDPNSKNIQVVGGTSAQSNYLRQTQYARYVLNLGYSELEENIEYQWDNQCYGTGYGSGANDANCNTDPIFPIAITPLGTAAVTLNGSNGWMTGATYDNNPGCAPDASTDPVWTCAMTKGGVQTPIKYIQNDSSTTTTFNSAAYTATDVNALTRFHSNTTTLEISPLLFTPISGAVGTPTFSPVAGTYGTTQTVTITCPTSGSVGVFTIDGSTPIATSTAISGTVSVAASETVKAVCYGVPGKDNSSVGSAAYVISGSGACGAIGTYPATTAADQTTCGNVAPFPAAPTSPTSIAACGTLAANTKYQLSANVTSSVSTTCFTVTGPGTVLDWNGHTITGFVDVQNANGLHLYSSAAGAASNCTDDTAHACIYGNLSQSTIDALTEIDHITVTNSAVSTSSARNVFLDYGSANSGTLSGVVNIKIHNMNSMSATGLSSFRIVNLQVQGIAGGTKAYPEFYNNVTTCQSTAAACQGVVAYGVWDAKIHNNKLVNQLANASSSETPRGVICDQTAACEIYNNWHDAQDGRAFRFRGTNNTNDVNSAHDNYIANVVAGTNGNHVAAIHIGDPDSGSEVENVTINHNWIDYTSGLVVMSRSATSIFFQDNDINCVSCAGHGSGGLYFLRFSTPAASSTNILRTTYSGGTLDAPQSSCDASTTSLVCQSGTATGCTVNNGSC